MARHLVTGGSGFVGSHLAEYLLDRGESVRVLDLISPDVPGTDLVERVEYVEGDVRNAETVRGALDGVDYVHHTVALVPLTKAGANFREVNVEGTRTVAEAALEAGVDGFVNVSSSAVYDISAMPVTETTATAPIGRYGESKLAADRVVLDAATRGLPATILRPRTVLDERRAGIYQILFDWIEEDRRVFMLGDGRNRFQLVSARDFAEAAWLAATSDFHGEVFNIGNHEYGTLGQDLRHLIDYAGSESSIVWIPAGPASTVLGILDRLRLSPLAPWHYLTVHREYFFDTTKAVETLGWEPTDSNAAMFERSFDWFSAHDVEAAGAGGSVHRTAPDQRILRLLRRFA